MQKLTDEQEAIVQAEDDLMAVTAYAGTGKTSTLKAYANKRVHDQMLYLAFNRALAEEAKIAFSASPNVYVKTLHALAFNKVGKNYVSKLGNFRVLDLFRYFPKQQDAAKIMPSRVLFELLNAWTMSSDMTIEAFFKKNFHKVQEDLKGGKITRENMLSALKECWEDMMEGRFTMTHNGYFKLFQLSKPTLEHFSYLLVDEAQDLNEAMLKVILGASGKKILVGDPYQQIYGWNGAVNAIGKASKQGAAQYFLTKSFRCPSHISEIANKYLVLLGAKKKFHGTNGSPPTSKSHKCENIIIARTNAAIFDFAAKNMRGVKIFYNGGFDGYQFEILKDLNYLRQGKLKLIRDPFIKKFPEYHVLEDYASSALDIPMKVRIEVEKKYEGAVHGIFERMKECQAETEKDADVVITTAHKTKGQEYSQVTLLNDFVSLKDILAKVESDFSGDLIKGEAKVKEPVHMKREEFQLVYVAVTRSFNTLNLSTDYLISDNEIDLLKKYVKKKRIILE
ncbi:MAG: UvrD-helicase domain-containing protein [Deltaproteobacteria bacterium]|nr:UvrD-helicase domain-containing protein [Deltaproteobacteria bacterium]